MTTGDPQTNGRPGPARPRAATIGVVAVTALVMGNMIGAGIFTIPNQIGQYGWYGILAFAVTAVGALLLGLVFADLARRIPKTGGPYAYTKAAFGDFPGFWIAWGYWIGLWTGQVAIAVTFCGYVGIFIPVFQESMYWNAALAFAVLWAVTGVNLRGIVAAGNVAVVTTIIRVVPLVAVATAGWFSFDAANYAPSLPPGTGVFGAVSAAAAITLFSFLGLESGTVPAGNVREPAKTIPRATIIGILIVAALYVVSTTVVLGVLDTDALTEGSTAFADAGKAMWGNAGYYLVGVAGVVSTLGALSGFALLSGQVPYAAALDKLFPARFALKNRFDAPWFGIVASSVLVSAFMGVGYVAIWTQGSGGSTADLSTASILIATLTTVLPYAFCSIAETVLVARDKVAGRTAHMARLLILPSIAFAYSLLIVKGAGAESIEWGLFLMLFGLPVYAYLQYGGAKDSPLLPPVAHDGAPAGPSTKSPPPAG
jgi:APA family basic amino acid/polyamine antiporter